MSTLTSAQARALKARAQTLKASLKVGKEGVTPALLAALDEQLRVHELVKVKFAALKEQKKDLAPDMARQSGSELVTRVGNVVVLFRPRPAPGNDARSRG